MNYEKRCGSGRVERVEGPDRVKNKWRQILGEKGLKRVTGSHRVLRN